MLVLSRNCGQSIVIGEGPDQVTLVIGRKTSIVIDAPPHIPVDRGEVRARREAEAKGATDAAS